MAQLTCARCRKAKDAAEMYVCYHCGAFICGDCTKDNLCPTCFDGLSRIM